MSGKQQQEVSKPKEFKMEATAGGGTGFERDIFLAITERGEKIARSGEKDKIFFAGSSGSKKSDNHDQLRKQFQERRKNYPTAEEAYLILKSLFASNNYKDVGNRYDWAIRVLTHEIYKYGTAKNIKELHALYKEPNAQQYLKADDHALGLSLNSQLGTPGKRKGYKDLEKMQEFYKFHVYFRSITNGYQNNLAEQARFIKKLETKLAKNQAKHTSPSKGSSESITPQMEKFDIKEVPSPAREGSIPNLEGGTSAVCLKSAGFFKNTVDPSISTLKAGPESGLSSVRFHGKNELSPIFLQQKPTDPEQSGSDSPGMGKR